LPKSSIRRAAARNRLIQALAGRLSSLGPREVADRVEAIAAIFQGLIVRAVHNPDLTATHSSAPRSSSCANYSPTI
jgi:hypothetical protein